MECVQCIVDFARWLSWGALFCSFILGGWFGMFIMCMVALNREREREAARVAVLCECEKPRSLDS